MNASGSKWQMHGAAYGNGIYLAPDLATSFGYSTQFGALSAQHRQSKGETRFVTGQAISCVALCEVINNDIRNKVDFHFSLVLSQQSSGIWVVPNEGDVCTRFFFVFPAGHTTASVSCSNPRTTTNFAIF